MKCHTLIKPIDVVNICYTMVGRVKVRPSYAVVFDMSDDVVFSITSTSSYLNLFNQVRKHLNNMDSKTPHMTLLDFIDMLNGWALFYSADEWSIHEFSKLVYAPAHVSHPDAFDILHTLFDTVGMINETGT